MIRISLIAIAFLSVTIVLILMQPDPARLDPETAASILAREPETEVSRGSTDLSGFADQPGAGDLEALTLSAMQNISAAPAATAPAPQPAQTQPVASAAPQPSAEAGLEQLVIEALRQGQNGAYIDALVNDAAQSGKVTVPAALVTPDGRVDTGSLLAALAGNEAMALGLGGTAGGQQRYEVRAGDSLASISYRFYGTTSRFGDIQAANRDILQGSSQIAVGMVLTIPAK